MKLWWVVLFVVLFAGCAPSEPPEQLPLRGLDGEILEPGEMAAGPELYGDAAVASIATAEASDNAALTDIRADAAEDGWISPEFAQKLSFPGTTMTQYVYFSPYTEGPEVRDASCAAYTAFRAVESDATVEAGVWRATNLAIRTSGEEGSLFHAHAISFATPSVADSAGGLYLDIFRNCDDDATVESEVRTIDGYGDVEIVSTVDGEDTRGLRIAYFQRANIVLVTLSVVAPEDEALFDTFLNLAGERLMSQVFVDEVRPEDMDPALLALEEEIRAERVAQAGG